jgi:hypothetical protein
MAYVTGPPRSCDDGTRCRRPESVGEAVGDLGDRDGPTGADVEGLCFPRDHPQRAGSQVRPYDVSDMNEISRLAAVLVDTRRFAATERRSKESSNPGIRRIEGQSGTVDIVVSEGDDGRSRFGRPDATEVFLGYLRGGIHRLWPKRGGLLNEGPRQAGGADGTEGLESASIQVVGGARRRLDHTVGATLVALFTVNNHRTGQHQPTTEP